MAGYFQRNLLREMICEEDLSPIYPTQLLEASNLERGEPFLKLVSGKYGWAMNASLLFLESLNASFDSLQISWSPLLLMP